MRCVPVEPVRRLSGVIVIGLSGFLNLESGFYMLLLVNLVIVNLRLMEMRN